ncbi:Secreted protein [Plasmodiophora brassicae]
MALWKSYALLFAFLAGRCALGGDDDAVSDAVKTRDFDLNMAWDADQDPVHDMTSNAVPNRANPPFMVADDADDDVNGDAVDTNVDRNIAWCAHRDLDHSVASNTGMNDIGNLGDAAVDVAMSTAESNRGRDPASYATDHLLSSPPIWAPTDVVSYMHGSVGQTWVSYNQHQIMTSNFAAGATTSSSIPQGTTPIHGLEQEVVYGLHGSP